MYFPQEGGDVQVEATYVAAAGTADVDGIPAIKVTGISGPEALSQWLADQAWVQAWNSNRFLRLFFDPTILVTSFPVVLNGFFMSVGVVGACFPLGIPLALVLALMRLSKFFLWRGIATTYVNLMRGTPLFLQIYVAFFGLPLAGIDVPNFPLGVIVLMLNSGAYMCEIFRAGILSINKGQNEAARSLGMTRVQTMLHVIIPQMFRLVIPNLTNEFITLYKDSSLLAAVGVMELLCMRAPSWPPRAHHALHCGRRVLSRYHAAASKVTRHLEKACAGIAPASASAPPQPRRRPAMPKNSQPSTGAAVGGASSAPFFRYMTCTRALATTRCSRASPSMSTRARSW